VRTLGEYGDVEFQGACAFFDISGFSKLASRLGRREKEESKEKKQAVAQRRSSLAQDKSVRNNSLLRRGSTITKKGIMMSRVETIARQHEASLQLLPKILSERRGMGAETLALAIKELFGKLVDRIEAAGGDIIKFAGDALICVWSGEKNTPVGVLVYHAIQCGFELSTHVESISLGRLAGSGPASALHMHVSVGSGSMRLVNVGGESQRWEFWVCGDGVTRACDGVDLSKPGEIVICKNSYSHLEKTLKKAAKMTGETLQQGRALEGGKYHILTALDAPVPPIRQVGTLNIRTLKPLLAYCPCNVQRAIQNSSADEDSIRDVCTVFLLFRGMEHLNGREHVGTVDSIFRSLQRAIYIHEGILRQFVVDDKGAVAVIIVGFPYFHFSVAEQASRGVDIALHARSSMRSLGIGVQCGVTTGTVFCGNVGKSSTRCEYAAVGADVNLSARFMGKDKKGNILVDSRTAEAASEVFLFMPLDHMLTLKGVEGPVQAYFPASFSRRRVPIITADAAPPSSLASAVFGRDDAIKKCVARIMGSDDSNGDRTSYDQDGGGGGSGGSFVAVVGTSGVGKKTLLTGIRDVAVTSHGALSTRTSGDQHRMSIPFFPWRVLLLELLVLIAEEEFGSTSHMQPAVTCSGQLFEACKVVEEADDAEAGDEGEYQEKNASIGQFCEMIEHLFKQRPQWQEKKALFGLLYPVLRGDFISKPSNNAVNDSDSADDVPVDGMLCSPRDFTKMAELVIDIIVEARGHGTQDTRCRAAVAVFDRVDLFDRHSLLLLWFIKDVLPARVAFLMSSSVSSASSMVEAVHEEDDVEGLRRNQGSATSAVSRCFPFPCLNFLHERQHFLQQQLFSQKTPTGNSTTRTFVYPLPSIHVSNASAVFGHAFDMNFDDTVVSKAMALSGGNLKVACTFLRQCIESPGVFSKGTSAEGQTHVKFSPSVENGSLELPWKSDTVRSQLEHLDVHARELAQILSVLGVDVDLKAILTIEVLFKHEEANESEPRLTVRRAHNTPDAAKPSSAVRADKIQAALAELVAAEILVVSWSGAGRDRFSHEWGFASSRIRAAVYSTMTYNIRTAMHKTLTRYYQLAYHNDSSHFASIICYHAEAIGDTDTAVQTSLSAASEHMRAGAYSDALKNVQRGTRLLENHAKTLEDWTLLASCLMREAHLFLTMDKLDRALKSLSTSELLCKRQFSRPLPRAAVVDGSGGGDQGVVFLGKLFSCFRTTKLKRMYKVIMRSIRDINKIQSTASLQGGFVRLTKDFDPTMAIMGRLQRGYTIEGSVAEAELLLPSDAKLILQVQETLAYAKAAESEL
jgi:class 3 adenylate cyclase